MTSPLKIGIIGSGDVAQTLATGFLRHGHHVTIGSRDAAKLANWKATNPSAEVGDFAAAAAFGELIVLAVKGSAAQDALGLAGAAHLAGKPIIDATNPIANLPPEDGVLRFTTGLDRSLMEALQSAFPDAHFVKAFNSVGAGKMVNPSFEQGPPTMFICGNNDAAKRTVATILVQFGWEPLDMGAAAAARAIEPLCMLWCIRGFREGQWGHAFKLLTS